MHVAVQISVASHIQRKIQVVTVRSLLQAYGIGYSVTRTVSSVDPAVGYKVTTGSRMTSSRQPKRP